MPGAGGTEAPLFDRILEQEGAALRRTAALYESDPSRSEDLFQEICLALWRALPRFRGEASPRTFAFRIAHNQGLSHRARRRRERGALCEEPVDAAAPPDCRPGPERQTAAAQRLARLGRAMRRLPVGQRQVLALALEGLGHREAGAVLGLSENAVAVRLSRARARLRRELENGGGV